jgi:hypothetical protein
MAKSVVDKNPDLLNFEAIEILALQCNPITKRSILSGQLLTGTISPAPKNFVTLWW